MNIGLYQSASSLSALEKWQDAVAQNITASQSVGYRKQTVEFTGESVGKWRLAPAARGRQPDNEVEALFTQAKRGVNFSTGEQQPTQRDLDVAIQGDGFFAVRQPDGTTMYTRTGEFRLRPDRTVVSTAGCELMTEAGMPVVLMPGEGNLVVNRDGSLFQGSTALGKLSIQKFANPEALVPVAGGLFMAPPEAGIAPVEAPELMQGYLEQSNVQPMREMVDLVLISRAYEANEKVITTVDQQMEKTLEALG